MRRSTVLLVLSVVASGSFAACTDSLRRAALSPGEELTDGEGFGGVSVMYTGHSHGVGEGTSLWAESHGYGAGPLQIGSGSPAWEGSTSALGQYVNPAPPAPAAPAAAPAAGSAPAPH